MIKLESFHEALRGIHKQVTMDKTKRLSYAQKVHNTKTNVFLINPAARDYALVKLARKRLHALDNEWLGPMKTVEAKDGLVY